MNFKAKIPRILIKITNTYFSKFSALVKHNENTIKKNGDKDKKIKI